jgi:aspartate carbamoyltransferase catalytic subunit
MNIAEVGRLAGIKFFFFFRFFHFSIAEKNKINKRAEKIHKIKHWSDRSIHLYKTIIIAIEIVYNVLRIQTERRSSVSKRNKKNSFFKLFFC